MSDTVSFGYEDVSPDEKTTRVGGVFSNVASKYDVMNDAMSLGIHRVWKDAMMDWLAPRPGQRLLDVAGGTGDISFRFLKRAGHGHATVLDLTEPMLVAGRQRAEAGAMSDQLDWVVGDAMSLPFPANSFDVYTISFGIRNVTRPQEALNEAFRVLKPGGRLMVLEFSQIPNDMMQKVYDLYDDYCHDRIDRRAFFQGAAALTIGGVSALAIDPSNPSRPLSRTPFQSPRRIACFHTWSW